MPAAVVLIVAATMISTFLAPFVLARLYPGDTDFSRVSDIGQAYGAASAVISTLALGGVLVGLVVQYRQYAAARLQNLEDATEDLIRLAMEEPFYQQCWGSRLAPEEMEERAFLYCNRVMKVWKKSWAINDLSEDQARAYLASFFDSTVPREFWRRHGDWHTRVKSTNRRDSFLAIVNEEFLRAEKAGPPSRPYEPAKPVARNRPTEINKTSRTRQP
ncbi:hypothetical protein Apa02nite_000780 [Actinoplanes palleronii]|uniref:DUF4760 domain-containing protein n=2 Tax=Actinoplanes palleronii TaxID=113570 RepID=A0ABQ4B134_9ACTN|nr:hypothetical protein Apa02nite_000780 [Actinoplanes palleronii]